MNLTNRALLALCAAVLLAGCSFSAGAMHKKSRVIISTVRPSKTARSLAPNKAPVALVSKRHVLPTGLVPTVPKSGVAPKAAVLAANRPAARDLSASTDISYMYYQIDNLDPNSGEGEVWDYIDPTYPYIDIFLTLGQSYKITVTVVLTVDKAATSALVGISGFGDSADFAVPDDGSDVWVDLMVHPVGLGFYGQVSVGTVKAWDPTTGLSPTHATGTFTASTADKFFYTSDARLYYFNKTLNAAYEWTNINSAISTLTKAIDGTNTFGLLDPNTGSALTLTLYAICADPGYPGWFWVVGQGGSGFWGYYAVDLTAGPPATWYFYGDITADLENGTPGSTVVPTGIAADLYGDTYISFYNTGTAGAGPLASGVLEYYLGPLYTSDIPDTSAGWTSANSVITDLAYSGGSVYALASPNTTATTNVGDHGVGTADIWEFDDFLTSLVTNPTRVAVSYAGPGPITPTGISLSLPNKFAGMVQDGYLLVSQADFVAPGSEALSQVSLDLSTVTALP